MNYIHGKSKAAQEARETEIRARERLVELRQIEAELKARIEHRKAQLKTVPKVRSYAPTEDGLKAWEQRRTDLPEPQWGGTRGLYLATLEASGWEQLHRYKAAGKAKA